MTALPHNITDAVAKAGVRVARAHRWEINVWNRRRKEGEPRYFCGWYWWKLEDRTLNGPFMTQSACLRDAYTRLELAAQHGDKVYPMTSWRGSRSSILEFRRRAA
jgi:hypothetical protein